MNWEEKTRLVFIWHRNSSLLAWCATTNGICSCMSSRCGWASVCWSMFICLREKKSLINTSVHCIKHTCLFRRLESLTSFGFIFLSLIIYIPLRTFKEFWTNTLFFFFFLNRQEISQVWKNIFSLVLKMNQKFRRLEWCEGE